MFYRYIHVYCFCIVDKGIYWGDLTQASGSTTSWWTYQPTNAYSVETTSYALLAYLTFKLYEDSAYIVRWLIKQRDGKFRFKTTQVVY